MRGLATFALLAASSGPTGTADRRLTIFYTAEIHGAVEPCGCTSDPLGDVARYATVVRATVKEGRPVLLVDAGSTLYPSASAPAAKKREAARQKGVFLVGEIGKLGPAVFGVGEADLAGGADAVAPKRLAANLAAPFAEPSRLLTVGGVKIGILGVADPAIAAGQSWKADDPVTAAGREAAKLRAAGAEVVVALAPVPRDLARRIAKDTAVDFVIAGQRVEQGRQAQRVGNAFILTPGEELTHVGRLDLKLPRPGSSGPFADERGAAPSSTGRSFANRLVTLRRSVPADAKITAAKKLLDRKIGAANLRSKEAPVAAEPGRARFVGDAACGKCHKPAMAFWRKTVHARAWKTLVDGGKHNDYACVECHATGFDEIGGSSLGYTKGLENVQCETCHGPGSIHVKEEGTEDPPAVKLAVPESRCVTCHSPKHSDTFEYAAYLRDVLGPGHGGEARKKLGEGSKGQELRSAALAKAKAAGSKP